MPSSLCVSVWANSQGLSGDMKRGLLFVSAIAMWKRRGTKTRLGFDLRVMVRAEKSKEGSTYESGYASTCVEDLLQREEIDLADKFKVSGGGSYSRGATERR